MTPSLSPLRQRGSLVFSHMGFYVRDLERMARFYKDVLCFTETDRGDLGTVQLVFLSRDPAEHHQIVLMSGRLTAVPDAIALSRATMGNIGQNLFWAFAYNAALIPVAAGVLWPSFGVLLSPIFAAAAMALSSVFVLGNALRLRRFRAAVMH